MSDVQVGFSPTESVAEIKTFGSTVIRGAWRPEHLTKLREAILTFFQLRRDRIERGEVAPSDRMLHTHGAGIFIHLLSEGLLDVSILREMFVGSDYHRICVEYFGDDVLYVNLSRLAFRYHDPRRSDRSFV